MVGRVTLVGAGPGGRALLTCKGAQAIEEADVVIYDRLVSEDILDLIPEKAEKIDVGKENNRHPVPQDQINDILVQCAKAGKNTVRLKGGDCYLFGRGGEECEYLHENGVPFQVVPGVTSALAAPAFAGIPVTHRDYCSSVHIITAHARAGKELEIDFESLVKIGGTLVFLMGLTALGQVIQGLLGAGMAPEMPAAVIENGTRGNQRKVVAAVHNLAEKTREAGLHSPALIVVGRVCSLSQSLDWFTPLPLHGQTIVVTRPRARAGTLSERLRNLGAHVMECPCIETMELDDMDNLQKALDWSYDWLVLTSPTGVFAMVHALMRLGRDLRALYGMKIAVIGRGTAEALAAYGLRADLVPAQYDSEHLAQALLQQLDDDSAVLILRAQEGSSVIPDRLLAADIVVADIPIYRTVYRCEKADMLRALLNEGKADVVTFTSASTVKGFVQAAGQADLSAFQALCIGEQTAQEAKKYGMKIKLANNATIEDMIACLLEG